MLQVKDLEEPHLTQAISVGFPTIVKTLMACGTSDAHTMVGLLYYKTLDNLVVIPSCYLFRHFEVNLEISPPKFQRYEWNYPNIFTELDAGSGIQGGGLHKSASAPSRRNSGSRLHFLKCCHICFFEIIHCYGDVGDILGGCSGNSKRFC